MNFLIKSVVPIKCLFVITGVFLVGFVHLPSPEDGVQPSDDEGGETTLDEGEEEGHHVAALLVTAGRPEGSASWEEDVQDEEVEGTSAGEGGHGVGAVTFVLVMMFRHSG